MNILLSRLTPYYLSAQRSRLFREGTHSPQRGIRRSFCFGGTCPPRHPPTAQTFQNLFNISLPTRRWSSFCLSLATNGPCRLFSKISYSTKPRLSCNRVTTMLAFLGKSDSSFEETDANWNQWFAGITDGDGCFFINKQKQISFEITTHITDARILYSIKNKLKSGSVKLRSGSKSVRYRVKQRSTIIDITNRLMGKLQHPIRLKKFNEVCNILNIQVQSRPQGPPQQGQLSLSCNPVAKQPAVTYRRDRSALSHMDKCQSAYLSGLIDSDGTFVISVSKTSQLNSQKQGKEGKITRLTESRGFNQFYFKITSSSEQYLILLQRSYNWGKIIHEKANKKNYHSRLHGEAGPLGSIDNQVFQTPYSKYHWVITSYEEFFLLYEYLKKYPLKSVKMHRVRLALYYFKYKQLKYHLTDSSSFEYKTWSKFCRSWFKYD